MIKLRVRSCLLGSSSVDTNLRLSLSEISQKRDAFEVFFASTPLIAHETMRGPGLGTCLWPLAVCETHRSVHRCCSSEPFVNVRRLETRN